MPRKQKREIPNVDDVVYESEIPRHQRVWDERNKNKFVPKPRSRKITNKQLKAAALLPYCRSKAEALRQAGYSASVVKSGSAFRNDFLALVDVFYSNEDIMRRHAELMEASNIQTLFLHVALPETMMKKVLESAGCVYLGSRTVLKGAQLIVFLAPNWRARADGLDKMYKLKGLYAAQELDVGVKRPFEEMSDEELMQAIKEGESNFKKG
ncbi:MAG: hypothetical protein BWY14_01012 [Parcubacteria group bacterium ADurb.Bin192]|nr:MAG: hypothetical protein BWY14_01012 [Parcubacteria group bacterium ADurb.Bin192]